MDTYTSEDTISSSKEESLAKAISFIQNGNFAKLPLQRPNISTKKILMGFMLRFSVMGVFLFLCLYIGSVAHIPAYIVHPVATIGCLAIVFLKAKAMVRNAVLLYQKYAPEKMRRSCLFTPSCSEYMLLAVEKYGVTVGVCKGVRRLCRCHHPNGGEDYP